MLAYYSLPCFKFANNSTNILLKNNEKNKLKIALKRLFIFGLFSLPFYLGSKLIRPLVWKFTDGSRESFQIYGNYLSEMVCMIMGIYILVIGSTWTYVKCGLAAKSDFPQMKQKELKSNLISRI